MHTGSVHWEMNVYRQNVGKLHISITANMAVALQFSVCCCCRLILLFFVVPAAITLCCVFSTLNCTCNEVVGMSLSFACTRTRTHLPTRMHRLFCTTAIAHFIFLLEFLIVLNNDCCVYFLFIHWQCGGKLLRGLCFQIPTFIYTGVKWLHEQSQWWLHKWNERNAKKTE